MARARSGSRHLGEIKAIWLQVVVVDDIQRVGAAIDTLFPKLNSLVESLAAVFLSLNYDVGAAADFDSVATQDSNRIWSQYWQ